MAKYIVTRTSQVCVDKETPVEGATTVMVHWYRFIRGIAAKSYREEMRKKLDVIEENKDGDFGGFEKEPEQAWLCDIPDMKAFVEKYGKIILMKPSNKEGYWEVEIYDDYRE